LIFIGRLKKSRAGCCFSRAQIDEDFEMTEIPDGSADHGTGDYYRYLGQIRTPAPPKEYLRASGAWQMEALAAQKNGHK